MSNPTTTIILSFLFIFSYTVNSQSTIPQQCVAVATSMASSMGEETIQSSVAEALAVAIADVQEGIACAEAAAVASAEAVATATATAFAMVETEVQGVPGCGQASAEAESFAKATAVAIASAFAEAFAAILGEAEALAISESVSIDIEEATAAAMASAETNGGSADATANATATAVAQAYATAVATALAQIQNPELNCGEIDQQNMIEELAPTTPQITDQIIDDLQQIENNNNSNNGDDEINDSTSFPENGDNLSDIFDEEQFDDGIFDENNGYEEVCPFSKCFPSISCCSYRDDDSCSQGLIEFETKGFCYDGDVAHKYLSRTVRTSRSEIELSDCYCG